jgi:hypothetical protein
MHTKVLFSDYLNDVRSVFADSDRYSKKKLSIPPLLENKFLYNGFHKLQITI